MIKTTRMIFTLPEHMICNTSNTEWEKKHSLSLRSCAHMECNFMIVYHFYWRRLYESTHAIALENTNHTHLYSFYYG